MNTVKALLLATVAGFAAQAVCAAGLDELPPDLVKRLYDKSMLDPAQPTGPSAYRDFVAKHPPPWTIGYASSYAGNTWRANAMDHLLNEVVPKWKKLGLVKDVIITQSNLNDFDADPADAAARRPGRRRDLRVLLEPDGA